MIFFDPLVLQATRRYYHRPCPLRVTLDSKNRESHHLPRSFCSAPEVGQAEQKTILVVDDTPYVLDIICRLLATRNHKVVGTCNAADAMDLVATADHSIDLLITDVRMPEVNGRQLATALTMAHPRVPVLFLSGLPIDASDFPELNGKQQAFLRKPFSADALCATVRAMLGDPSK